MCFLLSSVSTSPNPQALIVETGFRIEAAAEGVKAFLYELGCCLMTPQRFVFRVIVGSLVDFRGCATIRFAELPGQPELSASLRPCLPPHMPDVLRISEQGAQLIRAEARTREAVEASAGHGLNSWTNLVMSAA